MNYITQLSLAVIALLGCVNFAQAAEKQESQTIHLNVRIAVLSQIAQKDILSTIKQYENGTLSYIDVLEYENKCYESAMRFSENTSTRRAVCKSLISNLHELIKLNEFLIKNGQDLGTRVSQLKARMYELQAILMKIK